MSTSVLADGTQVRTSPATARPLLFGALAALSAGAAAIHFAVTFEHFSEYSLYGVFFLVLAWAQLVWPAVLVALPFLSWGPAGARSARFPARWPESGLTPLAARRLVIWLWLGIAGNAGVLAVYFASRSVGLPIGPDTTQVEAWGGLDLVCAAEEVLLAVIAAAVLARPGAAGPPGPVRQPGPVAGRPAGRAGRGYRRDHRGHDARVGRLGGPGRHGLRLVNLVLLVKLDGILVGFPAGRDE
jgi:hypothetical protein